MGSPALTPDRLRQPAPPRLLWGGAGSLEDPHLGYNIPAPSPGWRASEPTSRAGGRQALTRDGMYPEGAWTRPGRVISCVAGGCPCLAVTGPRPMPHLPSLSFCMNVRSSSFCLFIWPKIACRI